MPSPILADAFGHHIWASIQVLDACAALDDARLATTVPGTYGSIMDIATLRAVMEAHDPVWQHLVTGAMDGATDVVETEHTGASHAPLGIRLAQVLHHGTDHRSQVCTALTSLGIEPPSIDVWDFGALDGRVYSKPS